MVIEREKHVWKYGKDEPSSSSSHEASADDPQMKEKTVVKDQKQSRRTFATIRPDAASARRV